MAGINPAHSETSLPLKFEARGTPAVEPSTPSMLPEGSQTPPVPQRKGNILGRSGKLDAVLQKLASGSAASSSNNPPTSTNN